MNDIHGGARARQRAVKSLPRSARCAAVTHTNAHTQARSVAQRRQVWVRMLLLGRRGGEGGSCELAQYRADSSQLPPAPPRRLRAACVLGACAAGAAGAAAEQRSLQGQLGAAPATPAVRLRCMQMRWQQLWLGVHATCGGRGSELQGSTTSQLAAQPPHKQQHAVRGRGLARMRCGRARAHAKRQGRRGSELAYVGDRLQLAAVPTAPPPPRTRVTQHTRAAHARSNAAGGRQARAQRRGGHASELRTVNMAQLAAAPPARRRRHAHKHMHRTAAQQCAWRAGARRAQSAAEGAAAS